MAERIPVGVYADDPISRAGIASQLRGRPEVRVVDDEELGDAAVAILVSDDVNDDTVRTMKTTKRNGHPEVVLILTHVDDQSLLTAVEAGAKALVRRSDATPDLLVRTVVSIAGGEGRLPPDLLGRLLSQVGRLQRQILEPRGLTLAGLAQREIEVLKLIAEGLSTAQIAERLCYSERTIKNVIHDVTIRLHLRNRSHAVAYALRHGLI